MPKLPVLTSKKLLKILQKAGFEIDHMTGSHCIMYNRSTGCRVTVPVHPGDVARGTTYAILKSAGIDPEDISKYL